MMNLTAKIKYLRDIKEISVNPKGDWIDLRSGIDITLEAGEVCCIPLGIAVELPTGCEAHIAPRSSTFDKWGIIQLNSVGVIDESYCGDNDEWKMPVLAMRKTHIHINDRICQFRIMPKMGFLKLNKVTRLNNENRGGFGSTGVN
jgi:dUTP pyrophosphatase